MNVRALAISTLLSGAALAFSAQAVTIDDFTVNQGPITLGPGEEPSQEEATAFDTSFLGGFRIMTPAVDEEAPASASGTASIGGGVFDCEVTVQGGCAVGWAGDEEGESFDFSQAGSIDFTVLEADPGAAIAIFLVDAEVSVADAATGLVTNGVVAFVENPTAGDYSIPMSEFLRVDPFVEFDEEAVTGVIFVTAFVEDGADGTVRVGAISSSGPIGNGPTVNPPDDLPPDEELKNFVSGTYYNRTRSGEGCQVTLEGDEETIVLTCYLFQDGEQIWIIGAGTLANGQVTFNMTITEGADFGNDFSADDVVRTPWGTAIMAWSDCNDADIALQPVLAAYPPYTMTTTKVTQADCSGTGPAAEELLNQGTLYDPARSGEGFQIAAQGEGNLYVLTWYTYLNGEQVWITGAGTRSGNQLVFDNLVITSGGDYGLDFDPADVVRTFWGGVTFVFTDCNNATAQITPDPQGQPEFIQFEMQIRKLVLGECPGP